MRQLGSSEEVLLLDIPKRAPIPLLAGAAPPAPTAPPLDGTRPRRIILLRWRRQQLTHRLRPELGADPLQGLDAIGEEIAVHINVPFRSFTRTAASRGSLARAKAEL